MALNKNIYGDISHKQNSYIADLFFSRLNLNVIQNGIVATVNAILKKDNPYTKLAVSRQSDREVMLLMSEFFNYFQAPVSQFNAPGKGNKFSVYNQVPIPAQFMFSDPGDAYVSKCDDDSSECEKTCAQRQFFHHDRHYLKKYNTGITKDSINDNPLYNPRVSDPAKIDYLNTMFINFITPKILYEIRNYLKYYSDSYDPNACLIDLPSYEAARNKRELSLQYYYSGKDEDFSRNKSTQFPNPAGRVERKFIKPRLIREFDAKTIDADTLNPRVANGETDVLFDSRAIYPQYKQRRQMWDPYRKTF